MICSHGFHFTHAASGVRYGVSGAGEHNEHSEPCRLSNPDGTTDTVEAVRNERECVIKGPYLPVGDVEFECRTHGVDAVLRDPARYGAADIRRDEMRCPVGEPDA